MFAIARLGLGLPLAIAALHHLVGFLPLGFLPDVRYTFLSAIAWGGHWGPAASHAVAVVQLVIGGMLVTNTFPLAASLLAAFLTLRMVTDNWGVTGSVLYIGLMAVVLNAYLLVAQREEWLRSLLRR
jgi:hypothetical protein